jgi:hypothetical protein
LIIGGSQHIGATLPSGCGLTLPHCSQRQGNNLNTLYAKALTTLCAKQKS